MRFVDSHVHLDGDEGAGVLGFASSAGGMLLACAVDERGAAGLLSLARSNPASVRPFVGVHPSEAENVSSLDWLLEAVTDACGVGEIGLDPTYSSVEEGGRQVAVFRRQLEVAEAQGKPVQVHSRMAEEKVMEMLAEYEPPRVLMHWLELEEALPAAMGRGYFISLGPALLYSKKLQRIAVRADPSLTLLETDSPVSYSPLGGVWGPMLVPSVAFKLSELRGERFGETLAKCNENALRFLGEKG